MFAGEKYLTRLTGFQCCHGGTIVFLDMASAASYKAAASSAAAASISPTPATAAAGKAAYASLGASILAASAVPAPSPLPAQMDDGPVVTKEDLEQRSVVVNCPSLPPCTQVTSVFPTVLSICHEVVNNMTQAAEKPVLQTIKTMAITGSATDGFGWVSYTVENQKSADELPMGIPDVPDMPMPAGVIPVVAQPQKKKKLNWIEIELLTPKGKPVAGERYEIELRDGSRRSGRLNTYGFARVEDVDGDACDVWFPDLDKNTWTSA